MSADRDDGLTIFSDPVGLAVVSRSDVDAYLAAIDEPKRSTLEEVRRTILGIIPDAEECISYAVPAFKLEGKVVAGLAAFKRHLSYLPHSGSVFRDLAADLDGYRFSTGALRFPIDGPLPPGLIEKLLTVPDATAGVA